MNTPTGQWFLLFFFSQISTYLSTGLGAVNTKEHNSVAVKRNTNFTDFKCSKNKISGGNCNAFCQTVTIQYSKTTARTRHSRKWPQTKPRRGQSYTVTLVTFPPKPRFTQKNEVDVCMHHMITNISCLVSNWLSIKEHYFEMSRKFLCK